jgi:uncharacterized Zn-finger protein
MKIYICNLCDKEFNHKAHYVRHINRTYPCVRTIVSSSILQKIKETSAKNCQNSDLPLPKTVIVFDCDYCTKSFTRKDSLKRHLTNRCKIYQNQEIKKKEIFDKLVKELEETKKVLHKKDKELHKKDKELHCKNEIIIKLIN